MCGIIGIFNDKENQIVKAIKKIQNRGKDGFGFASEKDLVHNKELKSINTIGHTLHSVVGENILQPFASKSERFSANCEIYNWEDLNNKHNLNARNDAELIFKLIQKKGIDALDELDGVYAFTYWKDNEVTIARDILGIKPIWYSSQDGFAFASEKKALEGIKENIIELNPRKILTYNLKTNKLTFKDRDFFKLNPLVDGSKTKELLLNAVKKRIPKKKFGILFSGGIDSTILAFICKELKLDFTCYTAALDEPSLKEAEDHIWANKVAKELNLKLNVKRIKLKDTEKYIKQIVPLIEDSNVVKVGVALPFFISCEQAKKDGCKVIFSGLGSEEIFAGYQRHKESQNINKECLSGLLKMYERDLYRDDTVTMYNEIELRLPFLDKELVSYALRIPEKLKIKDNMGKMILRKIALEMGLPKEFALRPKKAAQYGSGFHKAISKLAKRNKFKLKSEYLLQFYPKHNLKLAALFSSGKDSSYALYTMQKQNYKISCLITLISDNKFSWMFHTPNINLVDLQAESLRIPLIKQKTKGEKETELKDLEKAIVTAVDKYQIQGIVTGALYSNYQRDRIEKIADKLGLKVFAPLWHIDQETELRELVDKKFEVVLSSIAADGLQKSDLGIPIDSKFIDRMVKINKKNQINIAFEGGEAESLVLDAPNFTHKIEILDSEIVMENEYSGFYVVKDAKLKEK